MTPYERGLKGKAEAVTLTDGQSEITADFAILSPGKVAFVALRHRDFRSYLITAMLAMMADNIEHVISYWVIFQKFHSPALGGFAVLSHWMPFLLFSVYVGALADRFDDGILGRKEAIDVGWRHLELAGDIGNRRLGEAQPTEQRFGRIHDTGAGIVGLGLDLRIHSTALKAT